MNLSRKSSLVLASTLVWWGFATASAHPPLPATGSPLPQEVEFAEHEIEQWNQLLAEHVRPREFFENLQSTNIQPGAVYVQFRPGSTVAEMLVANIGAGALDVRWQSRMIPGLIQVLVDPGREHDAILAYLAFEQVVYAEPDYLASPAQTIPNDPLWNELWGMENIRAPEAWDYHTGNQNRLIAVNDTGVLLAHADLVDNLNANLGWNFFDGNNNPNDFDCCGNPCNYHGTHVAGTAAARGNNGLGVVGVNWRATIVPIKICGPVLIDGEIKCRCTNQVQGLEHAVNVGARVSNHSYGGPNYSQSMFNMILLAQASHHIVVASAGNDASNNDNEPKYPASYGLNNVISVANITSDNQLASGSNYGANSVHLGAPGTSIPSTVGPGSSYGFKSGTSMASPHVAGAVALLQAANGNSISYVWVRTRILHSVQPTPALQGKTVTGGRLDLREAVNVFGNFNAGQSGNGGKFSPFNNFNTMLQWTPSGFPLVIYPSSTNWTGTITQSLEIHAVSGVVTIGN